MKIVVHIGAGKTGSSSIQKELERSAETLAAHGMKYLGLMLDHASAKEKFDWQKHSGSPVFFNQIPKEQAIEELKKALLCEIDAAQREDIHTLIWSNEWIFGRDERVIPALKFFSEQGATIDVVAYVRRHDKWAMSAYLQWGIKNKENKGSILSFAEWAANRKFNFADVLEKWSDELGQEINVLNYDAIDDVVQNFFTWLGVSRDVGSRDNVTPSSEILAAWAIYNNRFEGPVPMNRFDQLLRRVKNANQNGTRLPSFEHLLPTEKDIVEIRKRHEHDQKRINAMLARSSEPPLELDGPIKLPQAPSEWQLHHLMMETIFNLHDRVSRLEKLLKDNEIT